MTDAGGPVPPARQPTPATPDWPNEPRREFGVRAPRGPAIAIFPTGQGSPLVLVHGATADHTTWRTSGPLLAARHTLYPIDRRDRALSGLSRPGEPYEIDREFEDLVAVVDAAADVAREPVDVVGHSYGGRIGLGAASTTATRSSNSRSIS